MSKRVRSLYEDYSEVEMVTKDIEEINQEVLQLMETNTQMLNDFRDLKDKLFPDSPKKDLKV